MTALSSWPARRQPFFEAPHIPKMAATAPGNGGRAWFGACKTEREQRLSARVGARQVGQVGRGCSTMGAIRTFVLEVMEMGDRPELQDPPEPTQPGKLLTAEQYSAPAEEILSTPDEAPAADPRPGRPKRVLDLDALIAEQEAEKGERRGISVARLLAASEGTGSVIQDLPTIGYLQRALMLDPAEMLASMAATPNLRDMVDSLTMTAIAHFATLKHVTTLTPIATAIRQTWQPILDSLSAVSAPVTVISGMADSLRPMLDTVQAMSERQRVFSNNLSAYFAFNNLKLTDWLGESLSALTSDMFTLKHQLSGIFDAVGRLLERRWIADFLAAMSIDRDDPILADKSHEQLLADARTLDDIFKRRADFALKLDDVQATAEILTRYGAEWYIPPQPIRRQELTDDQQWYNEMARREANGQITRQEIYRADAARRHVDYDNSPRGPGSARKMSEDRTRKELERARKRIGIRPAARKLVTKHVTSKALKS